MGELNRRPDAPEPADQPEPSRAPDRAPAAADGTGGPHTGHPDRRAPVRPDHLAQPGRPRMAEQERFEARLAERTAQHADRTPKRVPAPVTGLRARDAGNARAEIADLKAQTSADRSALARPDARREPDRPENDPKLDAAYAEIAELRRQVHARDAKLDAAETKIAEQDAKLDRQQARLDEQSDKLEAANTKIADQSARIEGQRNQLDGLRAALSGVEERLKRLEHPGPAEENRDAAQIRIDERTSAAEVRDDRLSKPKKARGELRAAAVDAAIGVGGFAGTAMSVVAEMPGYVTSTAAAAAGAAFLTTKFVRKWRGERSEDRSGR